MTFKIISTTDGKYEGQLIDFDGLISKGDVIKYKKAEIKVDEVLWTCPNRVKIASSNYIAVFEIIK